MLGQIPVKANEGEPNSSTGLREATRNSQCMSTASVQDKLPPKCVPPPHVTISCVHFDPTLTQYGRATITDNCCLDNTKTYLGQRGLTHAADYTLFDATCNIGTIQRTFVAYDCRNNNAVCKQRIVVTYEEDYYVRFPDDRILTTCDGSGQYGAPVVFGEECEFQAVSFEDDTFTVVPDACFKIERQWKIINWCTFDPNCELMHIPNPNPNATANSDACARGMSSVLKARSWCSSVVTIACASAPLIINQPSPSPRKSCACTTRSAISRPFPTTLSSCIAQIVRPAVRC